MICDLSLLLGLFGCDLKSSCLGFSFIDFLKSFSSGLSEICGFFCGVGVSRVFFSLLGCEFGVYCLYLE